MEKWNAASSALPQRNNSVTDWKKWNAAMPQKKGSVASAGRVPDLAAMLQARPDLEACPGEGDRYGDHKCSHDVTHRVCAKLLNETGQPLDWGKGQDFWEITKQGKWDDEIRRNKGDSWCICMWATADLIKTAGCENVHIRCKATDLLFVMQSYMDRGVELSEAKACLWQKCGIDSAYLR